MFFYIEGSIPLVFKFCIIVSKLFCMSKVTYSGNKNPDPPPSAGASIIIKLGFGIYLLIRNESTFVPSTILRSSSSWKGIIPIEDENDGIAFIILYVWNSSPSRRAVSPYESANAAARRKDDARQRL